MWAIVMNVVDAIGGIFYVKMRVNVNVNVSVYMSVKVKAKMKMAHVFVTVSPYGHPSHLSGGRDVYDNQHGEIPSRFRVYKYFRDHGLLQARVSWS